MLVRLSLLLLATMVVAACTRPPDEPAEPEPDDVVVEPTPPVDDPDVDETPKPPEPEPEPEPGGVLATDDWTRLADGPLELTEVGGAAFAGQVWTAGGLDASGAAVTAVLVYDPAFDAWDAGPELPEPVHHAALVGGDLLYLLGGYVGSGFGSHTDRVWALDPATGEWAAAPPLPSPRAAGAAAWDGDRLVYGGGVGPGGLAGEVFALEDGGWRVVGELSQAREHLAAAGDGDGRVWFLAGRTGGFDTNLPDVDLVEGGTVRRIGAVPTARGGVAGFHAPGLGGCVVGGEGTEGTFAEVECLAADGAVTTLPPLRHARHGLGVAVVEGAVYAVLGGPQPGLFVSGTTEALALR